MIGGNIYSYKIKMRILIKGKIYSSIYIVHVYIFEGSIRTPKGNYFFFFFWGGVMKILTKKTIYQNVLLVVVYEII